MTLPPNRLRTPTPVLPAVDPDWALKQRRKARALSVARWLGALLLVGLALLFGHHFGEWRQALVWLAFAAGVVLVVVRPWERGSKS